MCVRGGGDSGLGKGSGRERESGRKG